MTSAQAVARHGPPRVSMDDIKAAHRGHFFDPSTMRFFRSRLPQGGYALPNGGAVFTTSEQHVSTFDGYHADPRRYSLRVQAPARWTRYGRPRGGGIMSAPYTRAEDGGRETMPAFEFQAHATNAEAQRAARAFALTAWTEPERWAAHMAGFRADGWDWPSIGDVFGISWQRARAIVARAQD